MEFLRLIFFCQTIFGILCSEQHCSKFHYEEQLLHKIVKIEFNMEKAAEQNSKIIETLQADLDTSEQKAEQNRKTIEVLQTELEKLKNDVNASMERQKEDIPKGVVSAQCPDNWTVYRESCYLFGNDAKEFTVAEHFCQQIGGHLVHVDDQLENNFLRDWISRLKASSWWLGLTDRIVESNFLWVDTNTSPKFTDWHPGQPDDGGNNEDCVHFYDGIKWKWNDIPCTNKYPAICERSQYTDVEIDG